MITELNYITYNPVLCLVLNFLMQIIVINYYFYQMICTTYRFEILIYIFFLKFFN